VTINLFTQEDRSPSGTGRAQFQTHALTQARRERTGYHQHDGGPQIELAPTILTGQSARVRERKRALLRGSDSAPSTRRLETGRGGRAAERYWGTPSNERMGP
jgi:hypothetical protein